MTGTRPLPLDLPPEFIRWNSSDPAFLHDLPVYLDELAARWSLRLEPHFPAIRLNYVAPATCADGSRAVLKLSRYLDDTRNEIAALRFWDGDGACRLLEADAAIGALLVERLEPGTMLVDVARRDDDAATLIAVDLIRRLWRPASEAHGLRSLASWCAAFDRTRAALCRGAGGFPAALFRRADALRQELLDSTPEQTILHGDLHHYNVLRAQREPWLAIDPKGLRGDRCFDVCQFLRNPWPGPSNLVATNRRRLDIFCAELGLDRARTKDWCFVHAMLDACWAFEDTWGDSWQPKVAYAEAALSF